MNEWQYQPARDLGLGTGERVQSLRREVGLVGTVSCFAWRLITKTYLNLAHRFKIHGQENLPARAPFIIVANHGSHLDAVALAAALPLRQVGRIFPIAAGDTFFTKSATSLFATAFMNALPIWRKKCGSHSLEDLRTRLVSEECIYILFPEGTRTRTGEMAAFKPGLGRIVAGTKVPVVPCYIRGAWESLPPSRSLPRPARITLQFGRPVIFDSVENDREGWVKIAQVTETAVRSLASM